MKVKHQPRNLQVRPIRIRTIMKLLNKERLKTNKVETKEVNVVDPEAEEEVEDLTNQEKTVGINPIENQHSNLSMKKGELKMMTKKDQWNLSHKLEISRERKLSN